MNFFYTRLLWGFHLLRYHGGVLFQLSILQGGPHVYVIDSNNKSMGMSERLYNWKTHVPRKPDWAFVLHSLVQWPCRNLLLLSSSVEKVGCGRLFAPMLEKPLALTSTMVLKLGMTTLIPLTFSQPVGLGQVPSYICDCDELMLNHSHIFGSACYI